MANLKSVSNPSFVVVVVVVVVFLIQMLLTAIAAHAIVSFVLRCWTNSFPNLRLFLFFWFFGKSTW